MHSHTVVLIRIWFRWVNTPSSVVSGSRGHVLLVDAVALKPGVPFRIIHDHQSRVCQCCYSIAPQRVGAAVMINQNCYGLGLMFDVPMIGGASLT